MSIQFEIGEKYLSIKSNAMYREYKAVDYVKEIFFLMKITRRHHQIEVMHQDFKLMVSKN
jgi:hypothetical protein